MLPDEVEHGPRHGVSGLDGPEHDRVMVPVGDWEEHGLAPLFFERRVKLTGHLGKRGQVIFRITDKERRQSGSNMAQGRSRGAHVRIVAEGRAENIEADRYARHTGKPGPPLAAAPTEWSQLAQAKRARRRAAES